MCVIKAVDWRFSFFDRFAILYRHQLAPSIVKRTLGTHLGYAAQSNEDASERDQSEGSDPPLNSRHRPKRQNLSLTGYCAMKCSSRLIRWHLDCD